MSRPAAVRAVATVHGVVQGVGFRFFVQRTATTLGLQGWVRNRPGGSVELAVEGTEEAVDALLAAVNEGPDGAWVREVEVRREPPTGASGGFAIVSGSHPGD